jgi:2,3-bisphosphoglycerate-independent phosphoglycerate mutase
VKVIEEVDGLLPILTDLHPEVMVVTADHSTPAVLKAHSWHPVPVLLHAKYTAEQMKAYAQKCVELEREECAKVCEAKEDEGGEWDIQQQCANAIRARGQA